MWCGLDMDGSEGHSSSAGAAIKGFNIVKEAVLDLSIFLAGSYS